MKIPTNKIVGWQKTKNCLPVLDGREFDLKDIRKWAYIKL